MNKDGLVTQLSININKIATLRNARGKNNPDVLAWAKTLVAYGADGITVHPRPDGRHIRIDDVYALADNLDVELNIEGYPTQDFLDLIQAVKPAQCTLVPDPPDVLTSNAGWKLHHNQQQLRDVVSFLHQQSARVSLFVDPYDLSAADLDCLDYINPDRVELYTEAYAAAYGTSNESAVLHVYQQAAHEFLQRGIDLNAGHDLNVENLPRILREIPDIKEVSIGHALICDALQWGMEETVKRYLQAVHSNDK